MSKQENSKFYTKAQSGVVKTAFFSIGFMITLVSTGCGSDTVQDTLNQQMDRQRAKVSELAKEYEKVVGSYVTADPSTIAKAGKSASDNNSFFYVIAKFNLT